MRQLAVGLCVRPTDGALLVEHGHDAVTGARSYRTIGGACQPGEAAAAAVVREWQEEVALKGGGSRTKRLPAISSDAEAEHCVFTDIVWSH